MGLGPDVSYSHASKIYTKQQPDGTTINGNTVTTEEVLDANGLLQIYGLVSLNGSLLPATASFAVASFGGAGTHQVQVTLQVVDNGGQALAGVYNLDVILSDNSDGHGVTAATMASFNVTTGTLLSSYIASKAVHAQTDATGKLVFNFGITATPQIYVLVQGGGLPLPLIGSVAPGKYS